MCSVSVCLGLKFDSNILFAERESAKAASTTTEGAYF